MPRPPRIHPIPPPYNELIPLPAYPQEDPPSYEDSQAGKHVARAVRVVDPETGQYHPNPSRSCQWKCCQAFLIMIAAFSAFVVFSAPGLGVGAGMAIGKSQEALGQEVNTGSAAGGGFAVGTVFAILGACVGVISAYTAHQRRRDLL